MDLDSTPTEWDTLAALRRDEVIGPAVKLAFEVLWHYAGGRPGYILITARWLGSQLGRSPSAAADWLKTLEDEELIEIVDRDKRGSLHVYVYHPNPGQNARQQRPDPQTRLPLELPAARVSPGKPESKPDRVPSRVSPGKPETPDAETPQNATTPGPTARVSLGKPERHESCSIDYFDKRNSLTQPQLQEPTSIQLQKAHVRSALARSLENEPAYQRVMARFASEDGQTEITAKASAETRREESQAEPAPLLGPLVEALAAKTDPAEIARRRAELIARQVRRVNDPNTHPSLYARVADAVIEQGLSIVIVNDALDAVDFKRREAARKGERLENPGAYYNTVISTGCAGVGKTLCKPAAKADTKTT